MNDNQTLTFKLDDHETAESSVESARAPFATLGTVANIVTSLVILWMGYKLDQISKQCDQLQHSIGDMHQVEVVEKP